MNPDYLARMSAKQLDEYGKALGIEMGGTNSVEAKMKLIETKRNNEASISVLGLELNIPKKRISDKRITDLMSKPMDDLQAEECMTLMLGEEQMEEVVKACTDEDGSVDTVAMGVVFTTVFTSPELKNL